MSKVKRDIPTQLTNTTRVYNSTFKNEFDENKHWLHENPWSAIMMKGKYFDLPFIRKDRLIRAIHVAYQHPHCYH